MGHGEGQEKGLRIAWQYKKYFGEQQIVENHRGENYDGVYNSQSF